MSVNREALERVLGGLFQQHREQAQAASLELAKKGISTRLPEEGEFDVTGKVEADTLLQRSRDELSHLAAIGEVVNAIQDATGLELNIGRIGDQPVETRSRG